MITIGKNTRLLLFWYDIDLGLKYDAVIISMSEVTLVRTVTFVRAVTLVRTVTTVRTVTLVRTLSCFLVMLIKSAYGDTCRIRDDVCQRTETDSKIILLPCCVPKIRLWWHFSQANREEIDVFFKAVDLLRNLFSRVRSCKPFCLGTLQPNLTIL